MRKVLLFLILVIIPISDVFANRNKWTPQEDSLLLSAVVSNSNINWQEIANSIPNRTPRQCKERYNNYLNPHRAPSPWTETEEYRLIKLCEKHGKDWKLIASKLGSNRSARAVKNRFHFLNKDSGGCYRDVRKRAGYQIHHLPSRCAWKKSNIGNLVSPQRLPAMSVPIQIHKNTKSFGNSPQAEAFRQEEAEAINTLNEEQIVQIMVEGIPTPDREDVINSSPFLRAKKSLIEILPSFQLNPLP